ncbi:MAG: universal stress protein [Gammaproteobacteria bacterium]
MELKRILVAIADCEGRATAALAKAAALARGSGATVTLFHSLYNPEIAGEGLFGPDTLERDIEAAVRARKEQLGRLAAPLERDGIRTRLRVRWDYPVHESIVREVLREKSDLIVVESHRHTSLARVVLSNTDWQLIRLCPAPVLFVKTARPYDRARVLAAVDPMHAHAKPAALDADILAAAEWLARSFDGRLHAAHVYRLATPFTSGVLLEPVPLPVDVSTGQLRRIRAEFDALIAAYDLPKARRHLRAGSAALELVAIAERIGAGIVVMGAISRSGLKRLFVGHTAERVIDRLNCDVLVLKPAGFRTPVPRRGSLRPVVLPPI